MPFPFEAEIAAGLQQGFAACGIAAASLPLRRIPNAEGWGYASSLALSQGQGKDAAQALAAEVAGWLLATGRFQRVDALNGYVNVYIDPREAAGHVLAAVESQAGRYGAGAPTGERVMVEFSAPNTHKEFHVGHLRNTVFGNALSHMLAFAGAEVITNNYVGDIGAHVIRCLWCLNRHHAGEEPPADRLDWLGRIYSEAVRRIEEEPEAKDQIAALFARWDRGDVTLREQWRETRAWCIDELERIYRQLGVHFDVWYFESEVEAEGKRMAEELLERGIAEVSEGLPIVRLGDRLGVLPILRSDGTSLYATKELALAVKKFREHQVSRAIIITGVEQTLYFKQLFAVLERYGFEHARDLRHIAYERINLPDGKMSSRLGNIVTYEDLAAEAVERVTRIIKEKNPTLPPEQRQRTAEEVAVSALKFAMLCVGNNSVITFDWERVLDFDGFAGPYLQYAYVRAARILEKAGFAAPTTAPNAIDVPLEPVERAILETLADFPNQVSRAAEQHAPVTLANYTYTLAKQFSEFYQACPVLEAPAEALRLFRLRLVAGVKQVLANGLTLLGLSLPEAM